MTDIDAIRKRVEAATPGPWEADVHSEWITVFGPPQSAPSTYGPHRNGGEYDNAYGPLAILHDENEYVENPRAQADAEFIAHARTDIPLLLAEIDRLTAITAGVRRCFACGKETIPSRGGADFEEEDEPGPRLDGRNMVHVEFRPPLDFTQKEPTDVVSRDE